MSAHTLDYDATRIPGLVLLVEDNPIISMNTEALLLDLGVREVKAAGSVAEAMGLLGRLNFDLAILDLQLGEQENSLPVAQRLSDTGTPIVFATGFGEGFDLPGRFQTVPVLKKPYGVMDLERILRGQ